MHETAAGLGLLLAAGVMNAGFSLPMKFVRGWAWENTWLLWTVLALLVLPSALAFATIPSPSAVFRGSEGVVAWVALAGAGWGVAQVLFGLALEAIGIALTFSIVLGLSAAMGSLIPLLRTHAGAVFTPSGWTALAGIALVLAGVALCAVAGRMRDRPARSAGPDAKTRTPGPAGIAMAILSGICASMMNVGFAYGAPLVQKASEHGANPLWTTTAIWVPLLAGGALPNLAYCLYLLARRKTFRAYAARSSPRNLSLAATMALLWFTSSVLYGVATAFLGDLGPVIGWPLFMSLIVIFATLLGIWTGEWKRAKPRALHLQLSAVAVLVAAVLVLSRATN
jgi:L-rhamnose-H+ transport protein